jgi:hypothetical protein
MPVLGPLFAKLEPRPVFRAILLGGYVDKTQLPEDFITELLRSGRRKGYDKVSRGVFRSLEGFDRARERYPRVSAPVTLVYSENDWSKPPERDRVANALPDVHRITVTQGESMSKTKDSESSISISRPTALGEG